MLSTLNIKRKRNLLFLLFFSAFALASSIIGTKELKVLIETKDFKGQLLDVRTPSEWEDTGIIKSAITKNFYDKDFNTFLKKLDKSKKYYVYCRSGGRSSAVIKLMKRYGINGVDVRGGIKSWIRNNYKLVKYNEPQSRD